MRWAQSLEDLCHDLAGGPYPPVMIRDIVEDTREVSPGCLFVAREGAVVDGRTLAGEAAAAGAVAVLADQRGVPGDPGIPVIVCADPDRVAIRLADRLFGPPGLPIVAVTGTNGKTTVATFLHQLLEMPTGLISSIEIIDGAGSRPARLTTPRGLELRRILARMKANGCRRVVMEASSHGLALGRLDGLEVDVAIFTNLSGDHLDFHGSMSAYRASKRALFAGLRSDQTAVLNLDDPAAAEMNAAIAGRMISCGRHHPAADCRVDITRRDATGSRFTLVDGDGELTLDLALPGDHNVMNLTQAILAAEVCGQSRDRSRGRLARLSPPRGRLDPVPGVAGAPAVFVDFAHTDAALATALAALRPRVTPDGRLIVVFGCGGDRDRTKRPRMAAVAAAGADEVIITSDNPRNESPQRIIEDVRAGLPEGRSGLIEPDRARAIALAIDGAGPGDVILIAGKGHETVQIVGAERRVFDDREVARTHLARRERTP